MEDKLLWNEIKRGDKFALKLLQVFTPDVLFNPSPTVVKVEYRFQQRNFKVNEYKYHGSIFDDQSAQKLWKREYEPGWETSV